MSVMDRLRPRPGLRVLVTAGANGIGARIARAFAEVEARVFVCDVDPQALAALTAAHPSIAGTVADIALETDVARLFEEALAHLGGLDVLVNNAGIAGPTSGVADITPDEWRRTIDVNLTGMFLCTRLAVPHLRHSDEPVLINLSSVAGRLGFANRTPYSASKWGVVGFTASLAKELGPEGIRVNALLPGAVQGDRIDRVFTAKAERLGRTFEDVRAEHLEHTSLRCLIDPDDIAAMAIHLCSPAGRTISGQALSVCGNAETI